MQRNSIILVQHETEQISGPRQESSNRKIISKFWICSEPDTDFFRIRIQEAFTQGNSSISSGSSVNDIIDKLNQQQTLITIVTNAIRWSQLSKAVVASTNGRFFSTIH